MSSNPEEIRRDIERTRADLSYNVNALADEANPSTIARRQVDKVKGGAHSLKTRIFGDPDDPWDEGKVGDVKYRTQGAVEDVKDRASGLVDDAKGAVQDAPAQVRRSAQGNPLAAGLIAFGLGALIGGLLPTTRAEQDAAQKAKEKAQPLVDQAKSVAQEAVENVKPVAQEAATAVKDAATTASENVKAEAASAKDTVTDQARTSVDDVRSDDRNPL